MTRKDRFQLDRQLILTMTYHTSPFAILKSFVKRFEIGSYRFLEFFLQNFDIFVKKKETFLELDLEHLKVPFSTHKRFFYNLIHGKRSILSPNNAIYTISYVTGYSK